MRIYHIERRGRPKKGFHQTKSIIAIIVMTTLAICLTLKVEDLMSTIQIAQASNINEAYRGEREHRLLTENIDLKEKLDNATKIETDDKTVALIDFYLNKYFGSQAQTAKKVFTCESHLSQNAINKNSNGSIDRGVAQINSVHAQQFKALTGVDFEIGAHDINLNLEFAHKIYTEQGWGPWVCARLIKVI